MGTTIRINKSGTLRVVIKRHELLNWFPEDAPQAQIKHWMELGKERESLREHLDTELGNHEKVIFDELKRVQSELENVKETLSRIVELFAQVAHLNTVSSTIAQYELETIKFKRKHSKLSQDEANKYNLSDLKDKAFRKLLSEIFPELPHDFSLTSLQKEEE